MPLKKKFRTGSECKECKKRESNFRSAYNVSEARRVNQGLNVECNGRESNWIGLESMQLISFPKSRRLCVPGLDIQIVSSQSSNFAGLSRQVIKTWPHVPKSWGP